MKTAAVVMAMVILQGCGPMFWSVNLYRDNQGVYWTAKKYNWYQGIGPGIGTNQRFQNTKDAKEDWYTFAKENDLLRYKFFNDGEPIFKLEEK